MIPNLKSFSRDLHTIFLPTDINECAKKPCSQICNNLPGTYACACKVGFVKPSSSATDARCNGTLYVFVIKKKMAAANSDE